MGVRVTIILQKHHTHLHNNRSFKISQMILNFFFFLKYGSDILRLCFVHCIEYGWKFVLEGLLQVALRNYVFELLCHEDFEVDMTQTSLENIILNLFQNLYHNLDVFDL